MFELIIFCVDESKNVIVGVGGVEVWRCGDGGVYYYIPVRIKTAFTWPFTLCTGTYK